MTFLHNVDGISRRARALGLAALAAAAVAGALGTAADTAHAQWRGVQEFPQEKRYLDGFLANENVPPYKCPSWQPYLENKNYAPFGTTLVKGISINQETSPWPIGVSITQAAYSGENTPDYLRHAIGIEDDPAASSVTNWTFGRQWYQVVLHCTDNPWQSW